MANSEERRLSPRIDCYSRSKASDDIEHGLVIDVSETGACLLIPKDTPLFKDTTPEQSPESYGCLHLNIFHPDFSLEDCLEINANIIWLNHYYSSYYLKVAVQFAEMDDDKTNYVAKFIDWIQKEEHYFLHSELEKFSK